MGQTVSALAKGQYKQGKHQVSFDGSVLPSGIYFLRLQAGQEAVSKKIIKL